MQGKGCVRWKLLSSVSQAIESRGEGCDAARAGGGDSRRGGGTKRKGVCNFYARTKSCRFGDKCKFEHEKATAAEQR